MMMHRPRSMLYMALVACALASGCAMPTAMPAAPPSSVPPPRPAPAPPRPVPPDTPAYLVPFLAAGCTIERTARAPMIDCREVPAIHAFGCLYGTDLLYIDPALASLRHAVAECRWVPASRELSPPSPGIVRLGCMLPMYRRYVIARDGRFVLADSLGDLAAELGPIESEAAALAFATAATAGVPRAALPDQHDLLVPRLEPTRVEPNEDGFDVRLFEETICGCGPHRAFARIVHVRRDGTIALGSKEAVYQDRSTACVD